MTLIDLLKLIVDDLESSRATYALAGGLVTSLYRAEERLTKDVDFLLCASKPDSERLARQVVRKHNLTLKVARQCDLEGGPLFGRKRSPVMIVSGQLSDSEAGVLGVDFLLPTFPWFTEALDRAQHNRIDFGIARIPCLTVEDVVIAKLHAASNDSTRFKDFDDLKSIFATGSEIDFAYLTRLMHKHGFTVPEAVKACVPRILLRASARIGKESRGSAQGKTG